MDTSLTSDWRVDEEDEPEAPDEEIFGPELEQDRMTRIIHQVRDLVLEKEAEGLDRRLLARWEKRVRQMKDADEAERFLAYLAA